MGFHVIEINGDVSAFSYFIEFLIECLRGQVARDVCAVLEAIGEAQLDEERSEVFEPVDGDP